MDRKEYSQGLTASISAYLLWGLLPIYWKMVDAISPYQIFSHRVIWSFLFIMILMRFGKKGDAFKSVVSKPRNLIGYILPSLVISANWLMYIWAVNNEFVLETSLGYFINPLVITLFGSIILKERMSRLQKIGIGFAIAGVAFETFAYGKVPIIALILAFTFSVYGLLKKKSNVDSITGLALETLIIGGPALAYMMYQEFSGGGITGNLPVHFWPLIMLSGIMTAVPMILFADGVKKLPLTISGFIQYFSPTIQLFLGIFVFKEPFNLWSLVSFGLIWIGIAFFTYSQILYLRDPEKA